MAIQWLRYNLVRKKVNSMSFTHLNIQTGYSLMKSTIKIESLVERAAEIGYTSLAITDEEVMSGSVAFYQACKNRGIKPIIGMRVHIQMDERGVFPTLLLAENNQGYRNLLKISSWVQTKKQSIDFDHLKNYKAGLIAVIMTAESPWNDRIANNRIDEVERELEDWYEVFTAECTLLSIQDRDLHSERQLHKPLKEWSTSKGVRVVAVGDVKYLQSGDYSAYRALRSIDEGTRLPSDIDEQSNHNYLKPPDQMEAFFKDWWPEVIDGTQDIVDSCNVEIDMDQQLIPRYPVPDGTDSSEYLRRLCYEALSKKYSRENLKAKERLDYELDVILSMEFSDYFLIVWDFIAFARSRGIHAGPGRGSAAGSVVSYLLDITQIDPIEYDLLFERFLNPERINMPDIDIDFPDHRRDEVITYVAEKYGSRHVAQICTFGTFAARSVLRELFKTMAIDDSDAAFILKHIPKGSNESIKGIVQKSEALKEYIKNSVKLKRLFQVASKLEGLPRHISTHAAGVIISEHPLVNYTALMTGQSDVLLTQLAMGDLEGIGLLKIDFLGLRNLTFIERIEEKVKKYKNQRFSVQNIPINDQKTFNLLENGRTNGVFQLESQGMKSVLMRLKPNHFEDVVAVNALYRPGPMEYIPTFIKRKQGKENINYPHPDLEPILKPTFGVLVYQEQIMQVAQKVAGYSLGQADLLRRAVSKKQAEVLQKQRKQFIAGCKQRGYQEKVADQLFEWIVKFSNYGFNRSHAVAYSFISYRLAYMKAHFPSYFLAELINANNGDKEKIASYIREAREIEVKVKPPSINRSQISSHDEGGSIRMGLMAIKGVGFQAAQAIIEERNKGRYKHLNDFCLRVVSKSVSRSVIESLILAGAFDDLQRNRASLLASIDQALEQGELFKEFQDQPDLFGTDLDLGPSLVDVEPFPVLKQLSMEKEVLGTYLTEHPLEFHRKQLRKRGVLSLQQVFNSYGNKRIETAAVVESIKEIRTKRGDPMAFLTLSDETTEVDAVLFPDVYRGAKPWISEQVLALLQGKIEERNGQKQMIVSQVTPFKVDGNTKEPSQRLFIKVRGSEEFEAIEKLKKLSSDFPGNTPVLIIRAEDRKIYRMDEDYSINISRDCLEQLNQYFGTDSVAIRAYKNEAD